MNGFSHYYFYLSLEVNSLFFFNQRIVAVKMGKLNQNTKVTKCLHFFNYYGYFILQFLKITLGLKDCSEHSRPACLKIREKKGKRKKIKE